MGARRNYKFSNLLHQITLVVVKVKQQPIPDMSGFTVGARCNVANVAVSQAKLAKSGAHRGQTKFAGTVMWTGKLPREKTFKVGVELDAELGTNSGVIQVWAQGFCSLALPVDSSRHVPRMLLWHPHWTP